MRLRHIVVAAVLFVGVAAEAESFNFSFGTSSNTFGGSGVLTTGAPVAPDEYLIDSVTGSARTTLLGPSLVISSILAPGVFPTPSNGGSFPANDNILFAQNGTNFFSQYGVSFVLSNGAQINLFNDGPGVNAFLERVNGNTVSEYAPTVITATTPEPSSLALMGTGLLCATLAVKRHFI